MKKQMKKLMIAIDERNNYADIGRHMDEERDKLTLVNIELHTQIGERVYVEEINKDNTFWIHCSFYVVADKELEIIYFRNIGKGKIAGKNIILPKKRDLNKKMNKMFLKLKGIFER